MSKTPKVIPCKHCGNEIARGAKVCPQCGGKNKKPIYKRAWFIILVALFLMAGFGSTQTSQTDVTTDSTNSTSSAESTSSAPVQDSTAVASQEEIQVYTAGKYLVGSDIEAGLYRVILTDSIMKMGYVERASAVSMELTDILANIILQGDGYVEIKETDVAVKLQGVEIYAITLEELEPDLQSEVADGIYLVGYDLAPGTYKVEITDTVTGMGYVERASAVSMGLGDIIANEIVQGQGYVEIKDTDFAVRVQGAILTLQ